MKSSRTRPLSTCDGGARMLMATGYAMALVFLYTDHQGHDGKPGLSVEDIASNYYGNRSGTRLEAAVRGPMAAYIDLDQRHRVVAWLKSGAPEAGYTRQIRPILAERCLKCHSPASGLDVPDLSTYDGVRKVAKVDTGVSLHSLMRDSHIHLFGVGFLLLGVGMIFRRTPMRPGWKPVLILLPFLAIFADIAAWFLTKWDPVYAYTVFVAGIVLGLALVTQIGVSLYQIWIPGRGAGPGAAHPEAKGTKA